MRLRTGLAAFAVAGLTAGLVGAAATPAAANPTPSGAYYSLYSRPDLSVPTMSTTGSLPAGTLLLTTPQNASGSYAPGPVIYDGSGQFLWTHPEPPGTTAINLTQINYRGQPALAWFEGSLAVPTGGFAGHWVVVDSTYRQIATINAGNGMLADAHELQISPDGTRAIMTVYNKVYMDLSQYGGSTSYPVVDAVVQEVDLNTGAVTWQWSALNDGGFSLSDSYESPSDAVAKNIPFDFFHVNSIDYSPDGASILISGRHVSTVVSVNYATKQNNFLFGGKRSTVTFPVDPTTNQSTAPRGQHDVRFVGQPTSSQAIMTMFDNGYENNDKRGYSQGVTWQVDGLNTTKPQAKVLAATAKDTTQATATQMTPYPRPDLPEADIVGSNRAVGNDRLISYGNDGVIDAFQSDGTTKDWEGVLSNSFGAGSSAGVYTYRTQPTTSWHGAWPYYPPTLAMDYTGGAPTAYVSWNGATDVSQWQLLAGPDTSHLRTLTSATPTGFETALQATGVQPGDAVFEVQALDGNNAVRGTSVPDPIMSRYAQSGGPGGPLGAPQGAHILGPNLSWIAQQYANGYITYSTDTNVAQLVAGNTGSRYTALGGPNGLLGIALSDETPSADKVGTYVNFRNGAISYSPKSGAHETHGAIRKDWGTSGFEFGPLGYPTTDEQGTADGIGRYNLFQNGAIYWSGGTGAHEMHTATWSDWNSLGRERSVLGYPTSDTVKSGDGVGTYNNFQYGAISYSPNTGAHETHGPIRTEWATTGFEFGFLNYPTSDVTPSADGAGYYSNFKGGAISWDGAATDAAHETHGPIRAEWAATGFEFGVLHYPTSDTTRSGDGVGTYSVFQGGAISYSPKTGAHATYGPIRDAWASQGYEFGRLGYPVNDPHSVGNSVTQQDFQRGNIQLSGGKTTISYY